MVKKSARRTPAHAQSGVQGSGGFGRAARGQDDGRVVYDRPRATGAHGSVTTATNGSSVIDELRPVKASCLP